MASGGAVQCFAIFLLYLFLYPGHPSVAEMPILEPIQKYKIVGDENRMLISYSETAIQLDAVTGGVPIINPTNPGSGTTPVVNPVDSPPAPSGINPIPTTPPAGMVPPATMNPPTTTNPPATTNPPTTTNPPATTNPTSSGGAWCIASPTASQTALQVALDYACGYGGTDCSPLQPGGSCYNPNTLRDHASYAFNSYYQKNPIPTSCVFSGTAQLTTTDPSSGSCHYASSPSTTTPSISPPVNPAPTPPTPTMMTPTITSPGGPPTVYGVPEPVGQPSSATSVSCSLLFLFSTTGIVGSLLATKHL
ncbi:hypothetical protein NC653_003706 [Populus alba x Populus x berolinensis]|uniref:X8 domain-containing protein n=1 Tax=Populus alba x Populus x berolinensis TaxID=444605 RepID=A0AAD6RSG2_9ROSI|nr:hypothetical protein NC653_003706 [Populus alba x Populus x berolinensis]